MTFFVFVIVYWINLLGLIYLVPPDLWFDNGYRSLDYVQTSPELRLDLLEDLGGQPDVLEIAPEENDFVVAPSTGPDFFKIVPEENALVLWAPSPSTALSLLHCSEDDHSLTSTALALFHRSEDDHSLTLILLMMLISVPVALLLYKVYLLVRRAFAKRPCEDSPGSAHDDDPNDVADEDSGNSSLKHSPSDMHDTEKDDGEVSFRSPMMTVLPQSIEDPINEEKEGAIETIDTSPVFAPPEMECKSHDSHEDANHDVNVAIETSPVFEPETESTPTPAPPSMIRLEAESSLKSSNKETVQDAESFIQFMGDKIPVDDHPEEGTSATLDVPRECHAYIYGKKGRILSEIQWKAKVVIIMPASENVISRAVFIKGDPRNIQKAAKQMEKILKKCQRTKD